MICFLYHKIIVNSNQEPPALLRFLMLCQVWFTAHGRAAYIAYTRLFRFSLGNIFGNTFLSFGFSIVVSVVLLSPLSIGVLVNGWVCFVVFFRRRCFAVSQFLCFQKPFPNKVRRFHSIRHRDFNSITYKVTRHIVYNIYIVSYIILIFV